MSEIINKVAQSGLITLDLEELLDKNNRRLGIDLADQLFQGLVLREKDFRAFVKEHDWSQYDSAYVHVHCSADAIIPNWAYMLVVSKLSDIASLVVLGGVEELEKEVLRQKMDQINFSEYQDAKMVIKGCSDLKTPEYAFFEISKRLLPYVSSLMYGEPCSTVPVFKKKK